MFLWKSTRTFPFLPAEIMYSSYSSINTFGRYATYRPMHRVEIKQRLGKITPSIFAWSVKCQRLLKLIIAFAEKSLRKLCENEEEAIDSFSDEVAKKLKSRLADLIAAETVAKIPVGVPQEVQGSKEYCLAIEFFEGYRLVFCANHIKNPKLESGKVDWSKVKRVKILGIESDHDGE